MGVGKKYAPLRLVDFVFWKEGIMTNAKLRQRNHQFI